MTDINRQLVFKLREVLKDDPVLKEYVKSLTIGDMNTSRMIFPFISIGNLRYTVTPHSTADDLYLYSIDIMAATNSLVAEYSFEGDEEKGKKGILQLCNEIHSALHTNTLGGFVFGGLDCTSISYGKTGSSGHTWLGIITVDAKRLVKRTA